MSVTSEISIHLPQLTLSEITTLITNRGAIQEHFILNVSAPEWVSETAGSVIRFFSEAGWTLYSGPPQDPLGDHQIRIRKITDQQAHYGTERPNSIEDRVVATLRGRGEFGRQKYGTTMDRQDLTLAQWGEHLQQEMLDGAQYAQRVIDGAKLLEEAHALIEGIEANAEYWPAGREWLEKYEQQFGTPKA